MARFPCTLKKLSLLQDMTDDARGAMTRGFQWVTGHSIDEFLEAMGKISLVLAVNGLKAGESLFAEALLETLASWQCCSVPDADLCHPRLAWPWRAIRGSMDGMAAFGARCGFRPSADGPDQMRMTYLMQDFLPFHP